MPPPRPSDRPPGFETAESARWAPEAPLGVHLRGDGVDVAVLASRADAVRFCVLGDAAGAGHERQVGLTERTHGVWHGHVPGIGPGAAYGFRVEGPWEPWRGHRYNPAKLLLDPYARAVRGGLDHRPEAYGHVVGADLVGDTLHRDDRDSAGHVPHAVVPPPAEDAEFVWGDDRAPRIPWADTVVYEAHVRGLTKRLPGVPERLRGTYAGLAHPATLDHLTDLGVTAVELLPVHAYVSEAHLVRRGLRNYWGYNSIGFFAPHAAYASDPEHALSELKTAVADLHAAGIEVLLDVVYNHTGEAGTSGPTLSMRGLDAAGYYRLDESGRDVDTTGCGNTLDVRNPRVVQLVLDSLRYWVNLFHVDGFRFDLAVSLARGQDGYDPDHPFLVAARADPVVGTTKLIAEPWDLGPYGWRTGQFPPPFTEWNDRFRDTTRSFWLADAARVAHGGTGGGVRDLATRLAGSADILETDRGPLASVNFVTAHDGFTLADLCRYDRKHNERNGEHNHDGTDDNRSWNHGHEGTTDDPALTVARRRSARNLLATTVLAAGVPMLTAGDELGRTQHGNNNAYCLDDDTSHLDWSPESVDDDQLAFVAALLRLRREHPVLRQRRFFAGRPVHDDGTKDLAWFAADGSEMDHVRWHDPGNRVLQMYLHGAAVRAKSLLVVVQGATGAVDVVLPGGPWAGAYVPLLDTADERPHLQPAQEILAGRPVTVRPLSLQVLRALHRPPPSPP